MPPSKKPVSKAPKAKARSASAKAASKAASKPPRAGARKAAKPAKKAAGTASPKSPSKQPARRPASRAAEPVASAPAPAKVPPKPPAPPERSKEFAIEVARMLADYQCGDVTVLDIRGRNQVMDFVVIGSGTSATQMRSVLEYVEKLGEKQGFAAYRSSRDERGLWLVLDCVDVVVHLFEPNTRAHYDLEMMWGDAPRVEWERPDQKPRDRAGLGAGG
ncbi:MAG: ribosome silencing factor [Leptolyngbya sp. PLA1]|nr:ribosome silencing factor [Leptolyngbya sp. PLA1]